MRKASLLRRHVEFSNRDCEAHAPRAADGRDFADIGPLPQGTRAQVELLARPLVCRSAAWEGSCGQESARGGCGAP